MLQYDVPLSNFAFSFNLRRYAVVPSLQRVLSGGVPGGGSNLRVEALAFTRLALESHPPSAFAGHVDAIAPPVFAAAADRYYKAGAHTRPLLGST
jgi:hypothetical protein